MDIELKDFFSDDDNDIMTIFKRENEESYQPIPLVLVLSNKNGCRAGPKTICENSDKKQEQWWCSG